MRFIWQTEIVESNFMGCFQYGFIDGGDEIILPCEIIYTKVGALFHLLKFNKKSGSYIGAQYKDAIRPTPKEFVADRSTFVPYEQREYKDGNKILSSKNSYVVECVENGEQAWQIRHRGYLYTDIAVKNGCAIFGTDGQGGGLYCIETDTGKVLCDLNTGGTAFYDWHREHIVLLGKSKAILLDPFRSQVLDEFKLPAKFPHHTVIKAVDNRIYGVIFTDGNKASVVCLEIDSSARRALSIGEKV